MAERDRKYKYHRPRNPREHLEAIYEELSASREVEWNPSVDTLKDNVAAVLAHMKKTEARRKGDKENEALSIDWALGAVAFLALVFLCNGYVGANDWTWLDDHRFAVRLWGLAFAALFVGLSIERSSFFKSLWAFGFTKLVASIAVSALVVFSTGKASSLINSVFPVDASALPYTRAIAAGLLAFQYSYPLLLVVALFALAHGLRAVEWIRSKFPGGDPYKLPPLHSIAFLVLSVIVLMVMYRWTAVDFSKEAWPGKIYRLAHVLDFDGKYQCANVDDGLSVIFLGPDQARVMVDISNAQTDDLESFVDGHISSRVHIPKEFPIVPCLVKQVNTQAN